MPERVPTHWNIRGEVDGHMNKPWGPLIGPLTSLATAVLLIGLPSLSPKGASIEKFGRAYAVIAAALSAFLFAVTLFVSLAAIGVHVDVANGMATAGGLLFTVIGNFMGKMTRNFFVGIRTPWTLSNDEVWLRTHRIGGKLFVAAGVATIIGGLLGIGIYVLLASVLSVAVFSVGYSYWLYRRLEGTAS